jgi:tetratricopeptide (TPR) repeat protein
MADRHYDDEALISFLEAGDPKAAAADSHLLACSPCNETYTTIRTLAETMKLDEVWDPRSLPDASAHTLTTLRSFADQMAREDAAADLVLESLLATPRETWTAQVEANTGWWTGGMVRRVLGAAERAIDTHPPDALELTAIATRLADRLDADEYPGETVAKLRGAAWRDRGYALYYTGSYIEAKQAIQRAESNFSGCLTDAYDRARVAMLQSMHDRAVGDMIRARAALQFAVQGFSEYGDSKRTADARSVEAAILYKSGNVADALDIWLELESAMGRDASAEDVARLLPNLGLCYRELGDFEKAVQYFDLAAAVWEDLGNAVEAARVRWNTASLYARNGRRHEGVDRLLRVKQDFETAGMASEAALAGLEAAEVLADMNEHAQIAELCRSAIQHFTAAGLEYSVPARTALAYLHDAVSSGRATATVVTHVRTYIDRLRGEPQLLFAPPPL